MKKLLQKMAMTICLSLSVSVQAQETNANTSIDDLLTATQSLVNTIDYGIRGVSGSTYYASLGGIAPDGVMDGGLITEEQRQQYMDALSVVQASTYYDAVALIAEYEGAAYDDLDSAIGQYVDATLAIAQVVRVGQLAEDAVNTGDVEDQQRVQDYINQNTDEVSLTSVEVEEYNTALSQVEDYVQVAAAWSAMSGNAEMITDIDDTAAQYNLSVVDVTLSFDSAQQMITAQYNGGSNIESYFDMSGYFKTVEEILTEGANQEFYTTGPTGNSCFYVPAGQDGC